MKDEIGPLRMACIDIDLVGCRISGNSLVAEIPTRIANHIGSLSLEDQCDSIGRIFPVRLIDKAGIKALRQIDLGLIPDGARLITDPRLRHLNATPHYLRQTGLKLKIRNRLS